MRKYLLLFIVLLVTAALACNGGADPTPTQEARVLPTNENTTSSSKPTTESNPTATATSAPAGDKATATPAPISGNLDDWTFMVYLAADNDLELPGLYDMNEIEAAGDSSGRVNVIVQMDRVRGETDADGNWTGTRRYEMSGDNDLSTITSTLVEDMGELNTGDPNVLTDFLVWGMTTYPAEHYAVVFWDHGAGWVGVGFDDTDLDELDMSDVDFALSQALAQTGVNKFDIVGFDACLMGQTEVYLTVQPYADYAVGSEELVPGLGWDYTALLEHLYDDPTMSAAELSQYMVTDFLNFYTEVEPDNFVTMSAVDLNAFAAVNDSVEALAEVLSSDPAFYASAVGDARAAAEAYALVYAAEDADYYAAIDLWHFASILSQRSPDDAVWAAAQNVMQAVEAAVIAEAHGAGFNYSKGISIYFPRTSNFYAPAYGGSPLAGWNRFLNDYHGAGVADVPAPEFHILNVLSDQASIQAPAYLDVEILGRDIETVYLVSGRYEPDGSIRLTEYDFLIPEPTYLADGTQLYEWQDGVHTDFFVWQTRSTYLTDGQTGDYVVFWPTDYNSTLYSIEGRYRPAGGQKYVEATLSFDINTGEMDSLWGFQGGESRNAPRELLPQPGDEFQIYDIYLANDGGLLYEPGTSLTFDANGQLYYYHAPVPSGEYFLTFIAETIAGESADASYDFFVDNDNLVADYEAYLDPYKGFQFLYPDTWYSPSYNESQLYTSDPAGETYLTITLYPGIGNGNATALKAQTLEIYGAIDLLFEDEIVIGGVNGLATVYGYEGSDGPHTGVFLTFVNEDTGYVVDIDGPEADQDANLAAADALIASWVFQPVGFGLFPGNWAILDTGSFEVSLPSDLDFEYEELESGWQLFSSSDLGAFVALRRDPASGDIPPTIAEDWTAIAGDGVSDFAVSETYRFYLADAAWARVDFEYTADDGTLMWGFIMATVANGEDVVAWAESPADVYNDLESSVFLVIIANALTDNVTTTGPAGGEVVYDDTFDELGDWGIGATDEAEGQIVGGAYQFVVSADQGLYWTTAGQEFGDGSYELDATAVGGPLDNGFGMMIFVDNNTDSFYLFEISSDGYVWMGYCEEGCTVAEELNSGGWLASDIIPQGKVTNRLRVQASNGTFIFFVNDQEVGRFTDTRLTSGDIGLFVETLGEGGVRIAFDNFRVTAQ